MILILSIPESISRRTKSSGARKRLEFLDNLIDDLNAGLGSIRSIENHKYPELAKTPLENFLRISVNSGISLASPLNELRRESQFWLQREREIKVEIAPIRATLNLLTYFPLLILAAAAFGNLIPLTIEFFSIIPLIMLATSLLLQLVGRHWAKRIIDGAST